MVSGENITNKLISGFFCVCMHLCIYLYVYRLMHLRGLASMCACVYAYPFSHMYMLRLEIGTDIVASLFFVGSGGGGGFLFSCLFGVFF